MKLLKPSSQQEFEVTNQPKIFLIQKHLFLEDK